MIDYVSLAEKLFTGGTILLGISILLCQGSWSTLMRFLRNYPEAKMSFKWSFKNIPTKEKLLRQETQLLTVAIFCFGLASLAALGSVWQSAAYMLSIGNLYFFNQDYTFGKYCLFVALGLLLLGFFGLGIFYAGEFKRILRGMNPISEARNKPSIMDNDDSPSKPKSDS